MKTFIIAALTADGFIAKDADHKADWTSRADKKFFQQKTKEAGVVIMGSKTYETVGMPLKERRNIVYTRNKKFEGVETTSEEPKVLLERLAKEGVKEVAICGGSSIYSLFMKNSLVDKLFLTVEPLAFGQGVSLFDKSIETKLELVDAIKLEGGAVVLEYNVTR
jgi:dihydrofolate reductase